MSEDALCTVSREGKGKREVAGKKRKEVLLVEKSESEEHSSDNSLVSGTLHQTSIPKSLSNEEEGDGRRKKDIVATKKSRSKAQWRDKLIPIDSKIRTKKDPTLIKALGRKKYLELLLEGKNGVQLEVISVIFSCIFLCSLHT